MSVCGLAAAAAAGRIPGWQCCPRIVYRTRKIIFHSGRAREGAEPRRKLMTETAHRGSWRVGCAKQRDVAELNRFALVEL